MPLAPPLGAVADAAPPPSAPAPTPPPQQTPFPPPRPGALLLAVDEARLRGVPVLYVRLDPTQEWLADVRLKQPLGMWELQLEKVGGWGGGGGRLRELQLMRRFGLGGRGGGDWPGKGRPPPCFTPLPLSRAVQGRGRPGRRHPGHGQCGGGERCHDRRPGGRAAQRAPVLAAARRRGPGAGLHRQRGDAAAGGGGAGGPVQVGGRRVWGAASEETQLRGGGS
jgi:hypothetical protein